MKYLVLLLSVLSLSFSSCGYVSKSTVHSAKDWRVAEASRVVNLPPVEIKLGERTLAYKSRIGFPPLPGGYVPSLLAEDEGVVKTELVEQGRGHDAYLTGLKLGVTRVYLVNGLVSAKYNRETIDKSTQSYQLTVTR